MFALLALTVEARTLPLADGLLVDQWTTADGLPLDHAKDIAFTSDGFAWIATFEGVIRFDGARFAAMPDAWVTALGTRRIAAVAVGKDGALWMVAEGRGVARWQDGELRAWGPEALGGGVTDVAESEDGAWIANRSGVWRLDGEPVREAWSVPGTIDGFVPYTDGQAFCTDTGRLYLASRGSEARLLGESDGVDGPVSGVRRSPDGEVTAVIGGRLRVWDGRAFGPDEGDPACGPVWGGSGGVCPPVGAPRSPWGVSSSAVLFEGRSVFPLSARAELPIADPRGDVWVPTSADGLLRLRQGRLTHLSIDGVDRRVDQVWVDSGDRLWARAAAGWRWTVFSGRDRGTALGPFPLPWITEIAEGDYLLVRRGVVARGRFADGAFEIGPEAPADAGPMFETLRRSDGRVLVAGQDGLAEVVDGLPRRIVTEPMLENARAMALLPGGVAVGTRASGLFVLDAADHLRPVPTPPGLLLAAIRHLRREGPRLWAATEEEGLCAVAAEDTDEGAAWRCVRPAGTVRGVHASAEDGRGRTWLSTNVGLWVGRTEAFAAFAEGKGPEPAMLRLGVESGMVRAELNGPYGGVVARDAEGVLWFPTQDGVVGVDPARFDFPGAPEVRLDGPVPARVSRTGTLSLAWTAPAWEWADQVLFQTRLGDGEWSAPTADRSTVLARLPPGPFSFSVRAGLAGAWGPETRIEGVRVREWDEGPLPWGIAAALAVVGAAAAVRLRTTTLRRRQVELERLVGARTAEVRDQAAALVARNATLAEQSARLAELEELRTRAIVNLHHELRTPLTLVMGGVERLGRPADARGAAAHELVVKNAARLEALMNQLADVARLEGGEIAPRTRRIAVPTGIATVLARFVGMAGERGVVVSGPPPGPEPHVWADPDIFEKILGNLVHNALKFTPRGGNVVVGIAEAGDHVRVEVRDTGVGVPDHARERVFDRLYQVEQGDDRPAEGSGIGLSLARELVELSGGEIGHAPNPPGGTCFWFTLPRGAGHVLPDEVALDGADTAEDAAIEGPEGGPLLLVVEDNADMRGWFVEELREGWRVATARDGEQGLRRAQELRPALVLSDVMMPRMDGLTLARRLRDLEDPPPVLLVSAKAGAEDRADALAVADGWLPKPFSSTALRAEVQRLCAGPPLAEPDRRLLARLQAAVDARLADPDLDVPDLARAVGTSERTLQRDLTRIAGVSPARWIREHRLRRAEEMLRRGDRRTVSEVAAAVGMSRAWFTRVYRAWAGRPPGDALAE